MKTSYIRKHKFDIVIFVVFIIFIVGSHYLEFSAGKGIALNFRNSFLEMVSFLPFIFILIGLFDVWISKEKIQRHIGGNSGISGAFWVILLGMLQAGPLYGAFPVAHILWKKGASIRNIFIYLGAFSTMKIPMLTFEVSYLGLKFSLMRTLITLPVFIIISMIMEFYLKNKTFEIKE
ncbi:MAG: permease [Candidatus Cloacimonetes bacterium]|nr:permease [Candidatus Cloacimonadota bacterium]